jgi:hypothetical protein
MSIRVAVPKEADSLAHAMKYTHGRFALYRNMVHRTSGHVWQERFGGETRGRTGSLPEALVPGQVSRQGMNVKVTSYNIFLLEFELWDAWPE